MQFQEFQWKKNENSFFYYQFDSVSQFIHPSVFVENQNQHEDVLNHINIEHHSFQLLNDFTYGNEPFLRNFIQENTQVIQQKIDQSVKNISIEKTNKKKKSRMKRPSQFHNFQKHLCIFIKNTIKFHKSPSCDSKVIQAAQQLWQNFKITTNMNKRTLNLIFNKYNELKITQKLLTQNGFNIIYNKWGQNLINTAKQYLTQMATKQLTNYNIQTFLCKTRIKNQMKFIDYIQIFKKQLNNHYIKKRFTNKNKKIKKQ